MRDAVLVLEDTPPLNEGAVVSALRNAFLDLRNGTAVQPLQGLTLLPSGGDVIVYQGGVSGTYGIKISPYLPLPDGGAVVTAWTLLVSIQTGEAMLLCDARSLTVERTAATTALAVELLAPRDARRLAIIGSGPMGRAHLRYVQTVRQFSSARMFSLDLREADAPDGVFVSASADEAIAGADVVLLCTSSAEPVIDPLSLAPGTLVTSISTNAPQAHEIAPAALSEMEVYGDYRPTVTLTAGEMVSAIERGVWAAEQLRGDLPELVSGSCPSPSGDKVVYFRSVGLGLEDVAVARLLVREVDPL